MSGRLGRAAAEALLKGLTGLGKAQQLYPPGHTATKRAHQSLAQTLVPVFAEPEPVLIACADGFLVVGDLPFFHGSPQAAELLRWLEAREVEAVLLRPGVSSGDLARFCLWLRSDSREPWQHPLISLTHLRRDGTLRERGRKAHRAAVEALEEAYREARDGRIPDPARAQDCVKTFSELLAESPSVLHGLVLIKDYDRYTFYHSVNVCLLSLGLGRHLGLGPSELDGLGLGAILHDIGKTRTPAEVVRKPGRLSRSEWSLMYRHPEYGRDILREMGNVPSLASRLVYEHHMRVDGGGYPTRPEGQALSPLSSLVTAADVYDAMTTHRPYNSPLPLPEAVQNMMGLGGTHVDRRALDAFVAVVGRIPVGSVVRLASGEVAVVTRVGFDGEAVRVKVVIGPDGTHRPPSEGSRDVGPEEMIRWVDPLAHGIDPAEVLGQEEPGPGGQRGRTAKQVPAHPVPITEVIDE